jgi:hypothetical protein
MVRYDINQGVQKLKTRLQITLSAIVLGASGLGFMLAMPLSAHAAPGCTTVSTSKGNLTAARVGGNATGNIDATGCDIGVYFNASNSGKVKNASVHDANQYGVFVDGNIAGDTPVNITNSEVYNIGNHSAGVFAPNGNQTGVGIYYAGFNVPGTVSGNVSNNDVHAYQKGGIVVNGSNASANVSSNDITGLADVPFIAQNGIQFGYGASGQAKDNTVDGNWYTGANWASTGILIFEASNVNVEKNTLSNNQTGIDAESWCYFGVPSANNNKFVNNEISGSDYGAIIAAYSYFSSCDAQANNNKVTNNTFSGTNNPGSEGVFVGAAVVTAGYTPTADNNKVIHNNISGFETSTDTSLSSAPKVHANVVE